MNRDKKAIQHKDVCRLGQWIGDWSLIMFLEHVWTCKACKAKKLFNKIRQHGNNNNNTMGNRNMHDNTSNRANNNQH